MRKHNIELPSICWCKPRVEVVNGHTITIHRCPDCGSTRCECETNVINEMKCKTSPYCSHNTNGRSLDKPCSLELKDITKE